MTLKKCVSIHDTIFLAMTLKYMCLNSNALKTPLEIDTGIQTHLRLHLKLTLEFKRT